jgi:hypothetical protein
LPSLQKKKKKERLIMVFCNLAEKMKKVGEDEWVYARLVREVHKKASSFFL